MFQIEVFTYNWSTDLNNRLDAQFNRLLHWTNARYHVTSCLLSQKMGLFHHSLLQDINTGKEGKVRVYYNNGQKCWDDTAPIPPESMLEYQLHTVRNGHQLTPTLIRGEGGGRGGGGGGHHSYPQY